LTNAHVIEVELWRPPLAGIAVVVASGGLLLLLTIYFVWLWVFSAAIANLGLALLLPISEGCYMFSGHGQGMDTRLLEDRRAGLLVRRRRARSV
jgi:hypothetical protein